MEVEGEGWGDLSSSAWRKAQSQACSPQRTDGVTAVAAHAFVCASGMTPESLRKGLSGPSPSPFLAGPRCGYYEYEAQGPAHRGNGHEVRQVPDSQQSELNLKF